MAKRAKVRGSAAEKRQRKKGGREEEERQEDGWHVKEKPLGSV